jgi:uncharacterized OB-fold protein
MSITIQSCARCRTLQFPFRLLCPACGYDAFTTVEKATGTIDQVSALSDGTTIGCVLVDNGPRVVARVDPLATVGARVLLTDCPETAPDDAYVPSPETHQHENERRK